MARLTRKFGALLLYVCIATVLAQAIGIGVLVFQGTVDQRKINQIVAVLHGASLAGPEGEKQSSEETEKAGAEQPSYAQIERARAVQSRAMELREIVLKEGLEQLRTMRGGLEEREANYARVVNTFFGKIKEKREEAEKKSIEHFRQLMELMKPKQAKDQMVRMLDEDNIDYVVLVIRTMNDAKRKKILAEFKTPEDQEQLGAILDKIRAQESVSDAIDRAKQGLEG